VKAVVLHETGGPDALHYEDAPDPQPQEDEVLVRIEAAGVNHIDLTWRAGGPPTLPAILGLDGAGTRADTGERVLVTGNRGTYAELVAAKSSTVYSIPDSIEASAAAALGVPYRTAWWSVVELGGLREGQILLVQSAATSTGMACIDVGRMVGATVFATAPANKLDKVRALGAEALEYGDPAIQKVNANVVFDPVGAETFSDSVEALEGTLVTPGALGDARVSFNLWTLLGRKARIQGIGAPQISRQTMDVLIGMAASGKLQPVIDRELPLEQAADAHRAIEARQTFGKVLLRP
jgi:NADPH:quinone reductase-like Zn-dependent oxidoreductase